jgi:hypothetical protein
MTLNCSSQNLLLPGVTLSIQQSKEVGGKMVEYSVLRPSLFDCISRRKRQRTAKNKVYGMGYVK